MIGITTREAGADLEHLGDYIAQDNPRRAVTFINEIVEACLRLADAPRGYPLVPRYKSSNILRRPFKSYLIFYRIAGDQIDVLHVLNGAQDYEPVLFPSN